MPFALSEVVTLDIPLTLPFIISFLINFMCTYIEALFKPISIFYVSCWLHYVNRIDRYGEWVYDYEENMCDDMVVLSNGIIWNNDLGIMWV